MSYSGKQNRSASGSSKFRYTYHHIFSDVCKTRFYHFATGLLLKTSIILGLILTIIGDWHESRLCKLVLWPLRALSLYGSALLLIITRKNYLHVDFLGYSSWITTICGQLISFKFLVYILIFILSASLISLPVKSSIFGPGELYELDSFHYNVSVFVIVPVMYATQHLLLDLDRLSFSYGTQHQQPQVYIGSRLYDSFLKSLTLAGIFLFVSPAVFKPSMGYLFSSLAVHLKIGFVSYLMLQIWDLTNIGFNAFLSIGCLHKGKPISSLSSDPLETLITGLRSQKPFVKLTAFQELSYRAKSTDMQLRFPIYNGIQKNGFVWSCILHECFFTIEQTNNEVSEFLITLNKEITPQTQKQHLERHPSHTDNLFGNNHTVRTSQSASNARLPGTHYAEDNPSLSHKIYLQENNVFRNNDSKKGLESTKFSESYTQSVFTRQPTIFSLLSEFSLWLKNKITSIFFTLDSSEDKRKKLSLFELYSISKTRESEKLCPVPICYADAIISLMGLLVNALDEDPKGSIVSSVGETLKLLERSIGSLGSFTEWDLGQKGPKESTDIISILYDLCINSFLEIVLKYDDLLNDVYLDEDVVKLTQWLLKLCQDL